MTDRLTTRDEGRSGRARGFEPDLYKRAIDVAARVHGAQAVPGSGVPAEDPPRVNRSINASP